MSENPFFSRSTLPYELPPFDEVRVAHYAPALDRGMAEQLAEIAAITGDDQPPDFDNTVVALERSGAALHRVESVFRNQVDADTSPELDALNAEYSPRLAAHRDAIHLDAALFARIDALYGKRDQLGLDPESLRLLERYHADFVHAGALLGPAEQDRLRAINAELARLCAVFQQNLAADTEAAAVVLDTAEQLAGLSPDAIAAAAANGTARGHDGRYVLSLKLFSNQSELAVLHDRAVRERLLTASLGRGLESNRQLVARIARLRAERAALLGHPSHAAHVGSEMTAGSTEAVEELLARLVPPAVANAHAEAEALRARMGDEAHQLEPWDWAYYAERVRKDRYDIDAAALRPYFELERVLTDGVFFAAGLVYGLRLTERTDLVGYHPDVRVFEVFDDDRPLGLYLLDAYARPGKRGGAWMDSLVDQCELLGQRPVVVNNHNVAKPPTGEPTLLTFDEVRTLFHEFGHALHGLLSDVRYPMFSGPKVPHDVVEYPSQVNEMWMVWPQVLANYARHHETGEPLPVEWVDRLAAAERFGEGFRTVEYLAAAVLDWKWHTLGADDDPGDTEEFETAALKGAGLAVPGIPPRYRSTYFAHVFAHDDRQSYSAGYYSYIWSEVLDADTVEWFRENGRTVRESGELFRHGLLAKGGSADMMESFRAVCGREPRIEPLLARRGLTGRG
ncbi:M3 family metallopeptidase [Streptantibioticus rubrisoli]|uniref:M3 family metallopeptidase n=1 Tax=Streptantibioticus rubrisoli TaxID=1387313 RepID=A0ABT1PF00_9ACTN|nr:M3 family metallopeptidase [Streptantibioticus rubrisoli]MCQ4043940.1 M3 family metallopeptidase [Streptantibioticus rubrisoli]